MGKISVAMIVALCFIVLSFCKPSEAQMAGWGQPTYSAMSGSNSGKSWSCASNRLISFVEAWDHTASNMGSSASDPTASGDASASCAGTVRVIMRYHQRIDSSPLDPSGDGPAPDDLDSDPVAGSTRVIGIVKRCYCRWQGAANDFTWNLGSGASGSSVVDQSTDTRTDSISGSESVTDGTTRIHQVRETVTCSVQPTGASYTVLEGSNYNTYLDYNLSFDEYMSGSIAPGFCQPYPYNQTMQVALCIDVEPFASY